MCRLRIGTAGWVLALTLLVTGGVSAQAQDPQKDNTLPAVVGDLMAVQLVEVRDGAGQVLVHGIFVTDKNTPEEAERDAELKSPTGQRAKGEAEIEVVRKDGLITSELEIEVERLPAMTSLTLHIDGHTVTDFMTDKNGKAEFKLIRKATN